MPLHVVFLSRAIGFPTGAAATQRVLLLARSLVERGNDVHVIVTRVSERPGREINRLAKGIEKGVRFEYTTGTPVRSGSFVVRRSVELRGWVTAARRLSALRRGDRLDCVYLYADATNWSIGRSLFLRLLRLLRVPVVLDLCERPWSLKESPGLLERIGSPLTRIAGVVAISGMLADWARSEFARLGRGDRSRRYRYCWTRRSSTPFRTAALKSRHYSQAQRPILRRWNTPWLS